MSSVFRNKNVRALLLFALFFSVLAFGAVEQWAQAVMEASCAGALSMYLWIRVRRGGGLYETPGLLPAMLILCLMALQLLPVPGAMLAVISPKARDIYSDVLGVFGGDFWAPVSVERRSTFFELIRYSSYVCLYAVGVQHMSKSKRLKVILRYVVVFMGLLAFASLLHYFSSDGTLLWLRKYAGPGYTFGPYVNKNHFAALMGMAFPLAVGLFLANRPSISGLGMADSIRETIAYRRLHKHLWFGFSAILIGSAAFVSLSRAAIISLCVSMIVFSIVLMWKRQGRGLAMAVLFVLVLVFVAWFGWEPIIERFGTLPDLAEVPEYNRMIFWSDSIRAAHDFLLTGAGFGAFGAIYPMFRSYPGVLVVDHAHNDYLELLVQGGILSFALAGWFVCIVLYRCIRMLRRRREPYCLYMGAAGIASISYFLVHALFDFNASIGANMLFFFFVSAIAVSASSASIRNSKRRTYLERVQSGNMKLLASVVSFAFFLIVTINAMVLSAMMLSRDAGKLNLGSRTATHDAERAARVFSVASALDPLNSGYEYARANANVFLRGESRSAAMEYSEALRLSPTNAFMLHRAAYAFSAVGEQERADALFRASVAYGRKSADSSLLYADWLIKQGRHRAAAEIVGRAVMDEPHRLLDYLSMLESNGLEGPELLEAMPEHPAPRILIAGVFQMRGLDHLAEDTYRNAYVLLENSGVLEKTYYMRLFGYFYEKGDAEKALSVIRYAINAYPADHEIRMKAGMAYEATGIVYRARQEYEKALVLDPGNRKVKARLSALGVGR